MIGENPRRPASPLAAALLAVCLLATLSLAPRHLFAQSSSPDTPSGETTAPDAATSSIPSDPTSPLPPYAPSNNAASPLLPSSPPLPPHPSIPDARLLPDSTPVPVPTPFPLPVPSQTGSALSPAGTGAPLTNGAPGTTPALDALVGGGATNAANTVRRFEYAFRFSTGVTYDDNVFLSASGAAANKALGSRSRDDVLFFIEPSVSLGYGDFISRATNFVEFDYTAEALLYTSNTDLDTVEHFINLQGAYHFAQITLSLSQGVQILDSADLGSIGSAGTQLGGGSPATNQGPVTNQVNLDASQRTKLNIFTTHGDLNYAFSDKTSLDLDGSFAAYEYSSLVSSETISGDLFVNYSPTGKIVVGLGATAGYVIQSEPAPNEFYQQINLRLSYTATGKLSFAGSAGIEFRETNGVGGTQTTPIFDLTANYAATDSTTFTLTASRRVSTSAVLTGENFASTGFSISASQRFFQRVFARLSFGYTNSGYTISGRGANVDRNDNYYSVQPSLDYNLRDNLSVGIFYVRRQSVSSQAGGGFSDNQVGGRVSLHF